MELSSLSEETLTLLLQEINNFDEINNVFMNNCLNKIGIIVKRFQGSTFDEFPKRRLTENQDTINELTARVQELQNEVNCLNDASYFQEAESVRSGLSHVTSQLALLPPF